MRPIAASVRPSATRAARAWPASVAFAWMRSSPPRCCGRPQGTRRGGRAAGGAGSCIRTKGATRGVFRIRAWCPTPMQRRQGGHEARDKRLEQPACGDRSDEIEPAASARKPLLTPPENPLDHLHRWQETAKWAPFSGWSGAPRAAARLSGARPSLVRGRPRAGVADEPRPGQGWIPRRVGDEMSRVTSAMSRDCTSGASASGLGKAGRDSSK
jgi:hypothetical protein